MNKRMVLIDIDNCIANVNLEFQLRGYRTDVYPSPIPSYLLNDSTIFSNAKPIESVINVILKTIKKEDVGFYITARPQAFHETTNKWLKQHISFNEIGLIYTNGMPKGELIKRIIMRNEDISDYDFVVFDDAPHEIISYLNMKKECNVNMDVFIPDWVYNRHINVGKRIEIY